MSPRHQQLLSGLTRTYIHTGLPVGSVDLIRRLNLDLSPATVRHLLHDLEEAGYVYQPYTSAGRIPTDQGFRAFVDNLGQENLSPALQQQLRRRYRELLTTRSPALAAAEILAQLAGTIALGAQQEPPDVNEIGLRQLIEQPHNTDNFLEEIREVCQILGELQAEQLEPLPAAIDKPQVLIGAEIPFHDARYTSLVVRQARTSEGELITLALIGVKRMPYARNLSLINHLAELINQY